MSNKYKYIKESKMQVSFRLDDDLADRLDNLAKETKRSKSFYFKEAISNLLDDFDDYKDAIKSIKDSENEKTYTIDDMSKKYGILL
ncbi:ribbon-helix-helix protein, CopG family [Campylobacter fetus]|uniref:Ribbon-helix-helix protein, CopG family n=2 Tax=Campylobacter fetus TaxID=196 RepID=A0A5L8JRS4_CAMFE|nr:ribbon-helix-helix protein, CopG family [Campylobacter fetus]KAA8730749.1 ribbon-helix-helix protein, CopG family [Campylobacter fetus subsp. fetus]EAI5408786.1 ribbon-helix-helix protein, CopG family [Campylobacter fetus]EAJ0328355.1 ribbon-helix-helix protein, CopG family [Campylobacter fetus]EAJ1231073.1 ribbon-helix-helix protein, CopG family [Campylobacter fetus]